MRSLEPMGYFSARDFSSLRKEASSVHFHSRSGPLAVERKGDLLELDFPNQPGEPIEAPEGMASALGASPIEVLRSVNYDLAVFETQDQVAALEPNETLLLEQKALGLIATAPGDRVDFVSRFFAPKAGIFEDPSYQRAIGAKASQSSLKTITVARLAADISRRLADLGR